MVRRRDADLPRTAGRPSKQSPLPEHLHLIADLDDARSDHTRVHSTQAQGSADAQQKVDDAKQKVEDAQAEVDAAKESATGSAADALDALSAQLAALSDKLDAAGS